jgi:D-alanyl-D-alanine carboxypeptidase
MIATARRLGVSFRHALTGAVAMALALGPVAASPAFAGLRPIDEAKYAAIVIDANTGEVLYARRADSKRYPASITKVMTLYMTFQALSSGKLKLTDRVMVSPHAAAQAPSKLGIAAGESVSVDDAIRAMCTKSANDMAVAMAEKLGGTERVFAALMTQKAQELGMTESHYDNASGLPDAGQISSARDIAILSRAVLRDFPQYYHYFSETDFRFEGHDERNHNHLLDRVPGVDGIKTGYTAASGFNLDASAVRDGHRLIAVVLGGSTAATRDNHVAELLNVGFDVLHRREQGEKITVAQRLFEDPKSPYDALAALPDTPAGAADAPPVRVGARVTAARYAAAQGDGSGWTGHKKKDLGAAYMVQVGSFREKNEARQWLTTVTDRFEGRLADAHGAIVSHRGRYLTRFQGLSRQEAVGACHAMRERRLACLVERG